MKLESKLQVSLSKRTDHVVLRRELNQLGSKSQLTEAIKRLIANGRLTRLAPGVYAKARSGPHGVAELAAPPHVIAEEILAKTGRSAVIHRINSGGGLPQFKAEFTNVPARASPVSLATQRKRRAAAFKLPSDVSALPVKGVANYVAGLAAAHGIVFKRTRLDDFAEAVTRLAGDDERLDATGKLLASLRRRSVINGPQLARLMTNHMREQKNAVRSVR